MPTTASLRSDLITLTDEAERELAGIFRRQPTEALFDLLPTLIVTYGLAAASVAADWFDDTRDEKGIRGRFSAIVAEKGDVGAQSLVGWAINEATDDQTLLELLSGGTQRRIQAWARGTITGSSVQDPRAKGWQRETSGGCDFCRMLESRGAVYSESTVSFASHDHCNCTAVPAWEGEPLPVKPYTPSLRNQSDADKDRIKDWMAENL